MDKVIVTVLYGSKKQVDLALPAKVPHQFLAEAVARALGLPVVPMKQYVLSAVTPDGAKRFSPATTLAGAGVLLGSLLELSLVETAAQGDGHLLTETGLRFPLHQINTVGRTDKQDSKPIDIDLSPLGGKVISHLHAKIERSGEGYLLTDTNSTNGTWLNEQRIPPDSWHPLTDGDMIDFGPFGKGGVKVWFHGNKTG